MRSELNITSLCCPGVNLSVRIEKTAAVLTGFMIAMIEVIATKRNSMADISFGFYQGMGRRTYIPFDPAREASIKKKRGFRVF